MHGPLRNLVRKKHDWEAVEITGMIAMNTCFKYVKEWRAVRETEAKRKRKSPPDNNHTDMKWFPPERDNYKVNC